MLFALKDKKLDLTGLTTIQLCKHYIYERNHQQQFAYQNQSQQRK